VKQYLDENGLRSAPHPPCSPDLVPSSFLFFGHVKRMLEGTQFQTAKALLEAMVRILSDVPFEILMATFRQWMERLQACVDVQRDCVE
jgi:hypothetical protein